MTRVVAELAPADRPFGVDFLWDADAALAIAAATGASFIREVATGVYESDMGLWNADAARLLRERRRLADRSQSSSPGSYAALAAVEERRSLL
jgi:predicted TIM-barrel enzyme